MTRLISTLALLAADRTSTPGVIFAEASGGPFVRSLSSKGDTGELWLVQNQSDGLGYRLTEITLDDAGAIVSENTFDFDRPAGELTGLLWRAPNRNDQTPFVMVSAERTQNVQFGMQLPPKRFINPVQRQLNR